jgi:hypothetical protein
MADMVAPSVRDTSSLTKDLTYLNTSFERPSTIEWSCKPK